MTKKKKPAAKAPKKRPLVLTFGKGDLVVDANAKLYRGAPSIRVWRAHKRAPIGALNTSSKNELLCILRFVNDKSGAVLYEAFHNAVPSVAFALAE